MKHFLRDSIVVFATVLFLFILPVEWLGTKVKNETAYKRDYMQQHAEEIKTLLLGNSLFEVSFNPHALGDSVFMSAQVARGIYYDFRIAEKTIPQMKNLRTVLFPIYIGDLRVGGESVVDGVEYSKVWRISCRNFPNSILCQSLLISGRFSKNYFCNTSGCDSLGYLRINDKWNGQGGKVPPRGNFNERKEYAEMLSRLAHLCHENGVRFISVTCPLTNKYLSQCTPGYYEDLGWIVATVQEQYPMEFCDYTQDAAFREDTLYYDINHLNHTGATLFAQRVKQDFGL